MSKIENIKTYSGVDLDNIFFRPMLTGKNAEELGIKVMYNMPMPTVLHFWHRTGDILQTYSQGGWSGSTPASKFQKTIQLFKVKAELGYGADNYFSSVYELITGRPDVNLQDLSGTELEEAETTLFRQSIAESIRATMWYGNRLRTGGQLKTFDGLIRRITDDSSSSGDMVRFAYRTNEAGWAEKVLKRCWDSSSERLKALKSEGELAYFVTTDVYSAYEDSLDNADYESSFIARQNGREELCYRGIPVVDIQMNAYKSSVTDLPHSFALLTDRRNLALAVNTSDFPGTEVRMWYNPDLMENRQRAVFMAGCDYLLPELISFGVGLPVESISAALTSTSGTITVKFDADQSILDSSYVDIFDADGEALGEDYEFTINTAARQGVMTVSGLTGAASAKVKFYLTCGAEYFVDLTV